jgi:carboxyl-terminal processing protease
MKIRDFAIGATFGILVIAALNMVYRNYFADAQIERPSTAATSAAAISVDQKLALIKDILDKYYVDQFDEEELNKSMENALYYGYVDGVHDKYTTYMDPDVFKTYIETSEGKFAGIGVNVAIDKFDQRVTVASPPFKGFPADKAGILAGDKIIAVNGTNITGYELQEAVALIKGVEGTSVVLSIFRESEAAIFDVEITREIVEVPTVFEKRFGDLGYIMITAFDRVTTEQFLKAYNQMKADGVKGFIVDVRNNPGGLLSVVADIADILIPESPIVSTKDKNGRGDVYKSDANWVEAPLAIIINGNSASASEVLAGAVQDTGVGVLVGTQSYGKGVVQNIYPLPDGSAIKVTISKYYTPNGICVDGVGLTPDWEVPLDDSLTYKIQSLELEEDVQLQKAIEILNAK